MKISISLLLLSSIFIGGELRIENMAVEDTAWITQDVHTYPPSWEVGDQSIAFESKYKGTENIFKIDLRQLKIVEQNRGMYAAFHLDDAKPKSAVYMPITEGKDTSYNQPSFSYNSSLLAGVAHYSGKDELVIIDERKSRPEFTGLQNVEHIHWYYPGKILIGFKSLPNEVFSYDTDNKDTTLLFKTRAPLIALSGDRREVFGITAKGFQHFDLNDGLGSFFPIELSPCKIARMNRLKFLVTHADGRVGFVDFNNNSFEPVNLGSGNGLTVKSNSENFIIYQSGMLDGFQIKKIRYPFR